MRIKFASFLALAAYNPGVHQPVAALPIERSIPGNSGLGSTASPSGQTPQGAPANQMNHLSQSGSNASTESDSDLSHGKTPYSQADGDYSAMLGQTTSGLIHDASMATTPDDSDSLFLAETGCEGEDCGMTSVSNSGGNLPGQGGNVGFWDMFNLGFGTGGDNSRVVIKDTGVHANHDNNASVNTEALSRAHAEIHRLQ